jgi:transposase
VTDHYPEICQSCGERLVGVDPNPDRHQVVELPPIRPHVEEHRLHQLTCQHCGRNTRAVLPEEIEVSGYGPRVVAIVAVLSGMYRHSHRMVVSTLSDLFGLKIALGTVNRLRQEASKSLEVSVDEAALYLRSAAIVGADETGFGQRNTDGKNPQN